MERPRYSPASPNTRPRFRIERILFPLVFAPVVLAILADKIPAVRDAKEKLLHPVEHGGAQGLSRRGTGGGRTAGVCAHRGFRRGAQYVEGVRVGEMGRSGAEVTFDFSCYVEPDGKVVKSHKQSTPRAGG